MTKSLFIVESDVASLDQSASRAATATRTRYSTEHVVWYLMSLIRKDVSQPHLNVWGTKGRSRFLTFLTAAASCCGLHLAAQAPTPSHPDFPIQPPILKVESKLVLLPVVVYRKNSLERPLSAEEIRCYQNDASRFYALSPEQPYIPTGCVARSIEDLTGDNFSLFQDDKLQKIETIETRSWNLVQRDNVGWHADFSDTPSGYWSTTDLGRLFDPDRKQFYYLLSYRPSSSQQGCHHLRVEVRGLPKAEVYSRDQYCAEQTPSDLLNGTRRGEELERRLTKEGRQGIPLFLQTGMIHRKEAGQRLEVVLEFPWDQLIHHWDLRTGALDARIGILGEIYTKNGTLVTRFSDLLWPPYWPAILSGVPYVFFQGNAGDEPHPLRKFDQAWLPRRYETQVDLRPGKYDLHVVLSDGVKFGGAEVSLTVQSEDKKPLALSSVFLCTRYRDAHVASVERTAANFVPQYVPLVSKNVEFVPAGDTSFTPNEKLFAYFQIVDPKLESSPAQRIQAHIRIVDTRSAAVVKDFPSVDASTYEQPGSTIIPIGREIPIRNLPKGQYRLEVQASDASGLRSAWNSREFVIH